MLAVRGHLGLVRRGHGDLHLGNIVLLDGKPVLFDAIEFDPLIAAGDVLYDLAFLLMDLVERRLCTQANVVFNRYLAETRRVEDLDALAALPLFLSIRAAIRAKVTAARLEHTKPALRPGVVRSAQTYFQLAERLIVPPAPSLVGVGGLSGSGKSLLAPALASDLGATPGAVVLRSDIERKALFGCAETDRLPSSAYTHETNAKVYSTLREKARRALAAGHAVIIDAVFAASEQRAAVAQSCGVSFRGLFLTAPLATRLQRLGRRVGDASDADAEVAHWQESYDLGEVDWLLVDASGTAEQTFARARAALL
jgi:predicted kinase